jgi:hypothetical protein
MGSWPTHWPHSRSACTLSETTLAIGESLGFSLRGWVVEENDLRHYVVTKHNGADDAVLATVLAEANAGCWRACMYTATATAWHSCRKA